MEPSVKISAVIITLNEEANIARCLASLDGIADEILIIDSFSTDRTVSICEGLGARVLRHAFDGHIQQKNWGVDQASYDHILSVDGDEVLSEGLRERIIGVKRCWTHDCYSCNRMTRYCGQWIRHSGWYPDKKLRLYDRRKGTLGGRNPHEILIPVAGATQGHLEGDILHFAFDSISEHMILSNRYSDIKARLALEDGKRSTWLHVLLRPPLRFFQDYFLRLGILDGANGFIICTIAAISIFLRYIKIMQLTKAAHK